MNGTGSGERLCNTSNLRFTGVEAEALLMALDEKNIYASSGSACMSGSQSPSHVLTAMGLSAAEAKSSIRFSFHRHTQAQEVESLLAALLEIVPRLRKNSHPNQKESYAHAH